MFKLKKNQTKIPCYVLIYDQVDIIKSCLSFLAKYSDRLDIIVVENPSANTPEISNFVQTLGDERSIKRYYLFDKNITNNAIHIAFDREREIIRKSKYVIISDGDVVSHDKNWLDEEIRIMKKHPEVFTCGITLDLFNLPLKTFPHAKDWIPADKNEFPDYFETVTGTHLEILRGEEFCQLLEWKDKNNVHLVDGSMHKYCEEVLHKKWARTKYATAHHLTWDLYADLNHPYTKLKLGKTFEEFWHHENTSSYTLTEY